MGWLLLLHRWTGGIAGLLLAVIGLSGAVLVWEDVWIALPHANDSFRDDITEIGQAVAVAANGPAELSRITFAEPALGLHLVTYSDGGGAYLAQDATVVTHWQSMWERPELWLFDLHHYLLLGDVGMAATGVLGLLLIAFTLTGAVLWWRTRRTFVFRLWPARMTRSAIVRHHRDLGIIAAPLLLLAGVTGSLMVFEPLSTLVLSPWAGPAASAPHTLPEAARPGPETDWVAVVTAAQARFPHAAMRRLQLPAEPGAPVVIRLKQDFEWTPNGRTYVMIDPENARVLSTDDPAKGDAAARIEEKFYPLHSGKVGGVLWRLPLTFAGLALAMLGVLTVWTFWFRPVPRPAPARRPKPVAVEPAE